MFEANHNTQIFLTVFIDEITLIKIFLCTLSARDVKKERLEKLVAILIFAAVVNMCNTN
jgi:hypothetical protein